MVLDLGLPGGDGMQWLSRWRSRGLKLPMLILTARDAVEQRSRPSSDCARLSSTKAWASS